MAEAAGVWRKGPWTPQEDNLLIQYITQNGEGRWSSVSKCTGLKRSGKSCRLRWVNYLRPGLKKGQLTPQEEGIIIELHAIWGNKWSTIARYLPGRTDNEIKNYWRTHFKPSSTFKKQKAKILNHKHQLQQSQTQSQSQSQSLADGNNNYIESPHSHSSSEAEAEAEAAFNSNEFWSTVYEESAASDFIPTDCYLWGGLWNLDGIDDLCSQMPVAPQQPNYHPFEGDAVDYVQSADFLL